MGRVSRLALIVAVGLLASGCEERQSRLSNYRAYQPIPSDALALMREKGTDAHKPILIRAFKKEAELEIWKMRADGEYVHFKTYPMCRWSGQLGPKRREGDRQVPEGFYTITQGQLNPNSAYYLSFNVGYPNAFDKAHGYTGGAIMVHGDCSSAGCFSMTDEQIAEIYSITREAFGGGQRAIQMQSLPFRMNAENLAKHRFEPNIRFWRQLKEGVDQFEVTKRETKVAICDKRYLFGATPADGAAHVDAASQCPVMQEDETLKTAVVDKQRSDEAQIADLVSRGVKAVKVVYADGGQHPDFAHVTRLSRPEAVARPPFEIAINDKGKPVPASVQVASAKPEPAKPTNPVAQPALIAPTTIATAAVNAAVAPVQTAPTPAAAPTAALSKPQPVATTQVQPAARAQTAPAAASQTTTIAKTQPVAATQVQPVARVQAAAPALQPSNAIAFAPSPPPSAAVATPAQPFYKRLLGLGGESKPEAAPAQSEEPVDLSGKQGQTPAVKPQAGLGSSRLPKAISGSETALPTQFRAYAPLGR